MTRSLFILILSFILAGGALFSQSIERSVFPSGFAFSQSVPTILISSVGEAFVGFSQTGSTSIRSGSLARNVVIVTGVKEIQSILPREYTLYQNYPNPFNPRTTVRYDLPRTTLVSLRIFDILGQQISTIVDEEQPAGVHQVDINLPNLPSGIYIYRIQASNFVNTKKFILLK